MTSRDVVNHVQRLARPAKVGHAGTLDPLAEGVLVVCLGMATRLVPYVQRMKKQYLATFLLGRTSSTDDIEGDVIEFDSEVPDKRQIVDALPRFTGTIDQVPPAYSAVKVNGRRAYAIARGGQAVELGSRPVDVYRLELEHYEYPELRLFVECGSGTYVRALGRDLAKSLGTTAVMSALTRTAIGCFDLEQAISLDAVTKGSIERLVLSPLMALEGFPRIEVDDGQLQRISNGNTIAVQSHGFLTEIAAIHATRGLVAVLKSDGPDLLRPDLVFSRS